MQMLMRGKPREESDENTGLQWAFRMTDLSVG